MSLLRLSRGIQVFGVLLVIVGIVGLVVSLVLSGAVKGQVEGLERMEAGVAETLDDAATATRSLAGELDNVRPVLVNAESFLIRDVSGTLGAVSTGLDNLEAGMADTRPAFVNLQVLLEGDTRDLLDAGVGAVDSGGIMLNEIALSAQIASDFATRIESEMDLLLGNGATARQNINRARDDLGALDIQPLMLTAQDIRQLSNEIEAFAEAAGVHIDTRLLRDHADYLEQQVLHYWFHPIATYRVTAADLRLVADELDAAVRQLGLPMTLQTDLLRAEADILERQGMAMHAGVDVALGALDSNLEFAANLAETRALGGVRDGRAAINTMGSELAAVQGQLPAATRFLNSLQDESVTFAGTIGRASEMVDTAGHDLASVNARLRDTSAQVEELAGAIQVGHDMVEVGEQNLTLLSDGLAANAADLRGMQTGQMVTQTVDWLVWYMVFTYVLFLLTGVGLFATGMALSRTFE